MNRVREIIEKQHRNRMRADKAARTRKANAKKKAAENYAKGLRPDAHLESGGEKDSRDGWKSKGWLIRETDSKGKMVDGRWVKGDIAAGTGD